MGNFVFMVTVHMMPFTMLLSYDQGPGAPTNVTSASGIGTLIVSWTVSSLSIKYGNMFLLVHKTPRRNWV